jgi:transcription elongation GreA/GreB family factor
LAERVENMLDIVAALATVKIRKFTQDDPIALTALIALEQSEGARPLYFLVPRAGGETLEYEGQTIHTITPEAPVGRALIGQFVGDEIDLELPRGTVRLIVARVE